MVPSPPAAPSLVANQAYISRMDDPNANRGVRARTVAFFRYWMYRAVHLGREPWDWLAAETERHREIGTTTRCLVCGLSIRGPLGTVNRAFWGITPLSKHPDLCNV